MTHVDIKVTVEGARTLYQAVSDALETWPGSPARPPEEQENYMQMKLFLFSIICEANYDLWTKQVLTFRQSLRKQGKEMENIPSQIMAEKEAVGKESNI